MSATPTVVAAEDATAARRSRNPLRTSIVERDSYFPYVDGLRGIAILMVVLVHVTQYAVALPWGAQAPYHFSWSRRYVDAGATGVQLFFILSAFTLYASSQRRYLTDRLPVRSFYVRRAFRILPLWWLAVAYWAIQKDSPLDAVAAQATFLFGFFRGNPVFDIVPGGWSLFVEETFYLLLPLLFARVRSLRTAIWLLIVLVVVAVVWTHVGNAIPAFDSENSFVELFPLAQWFPFAAGIVVYYLLRHPDIGVEWLERRGVRQGLTLATAVAIVGFIGVPSEVALLPTAALFLLVLASVSSRSLFGRLTRVRLLMLFGRYCYSIYLMHFIVLDLLDARIIRGLTDLHLNGAPLELRIVVTFIPISAICLALGVVSYNAIELTCVRAGRRVVARINRSPAPGAARG
jgi:peptidoglycan/LPS O-acetylase OafA/YrhL